MNADNDVIERAKNGDRTAFRELFLQHRGSVARLVQRLVPHGDVEDVAQDVFLHVYRSLDSFRGESRFSTWLYRLTLNVARMHLRKAQSRPKLRLVGDDEHGTLERIEPETPDTEAERGERVAALTRALSQLAEKKREALILHDFEGLPAEEIAAIVGAPVMTVRTRIFYGRKELYAALASEPALAQLTASFSPSERPKKHVLEAASRLPEPQTVAVTEEE